MQQRAATADAWGGVAAHRRRNVHFLQVALDLPNAQAAGIQRDDLVVKARPAGLMFGNELWFERALPVARNVERQLAEIPLQGLGAVAVTRVASGVGDGLAPVVTEVFAHFGLECPLDQRLGELLEQAILKISSVIVCLDFSVARFGTLLISVGGVHSTTVGTTSPSTAARWRLWMVRQRNGDAG